MAWWSQLLASSVPRLCRCGASAAFAAIIRADPCPFWRAAQTMEPILPYAMAFAAGAMIFVVVDDLIPEAQVHGNGRSASLGCMLGFIVMMSLDVALG